MPKVRGFALVCLALLLFWVNAYSQQEDPTASPPPTEQEESIPKEVDVENVTEDEKITERLTRIIKATEWFSQVDVKTDEGVVFLRGFAESPERKEWAGKLAGKTEGVVAVVNRMKIKQPGIFDFSEAWDELRGFGEEFVRNLPLIIAGIGMLILTWIAAIGMSHFMAFALKSQVKNKVLRSIAARALALLIFLFGLYLILRILGLTRLAVTVIGSTGLIGLIIGFAFRDIAENYLASILLSMQHPFAKADLIKVAGHEGYVQNVNTRSTLIMTLEGNFVQIPNSIIYKEAILNYTANPNTRFEFTVGIGYEDSIEDAQSIALGVLNKHPAVAKDPEPLILVDELGPATVNLRILFWIDINQYSRLKVRSSIIRLVKEAFDDNGISMPDEAREILFPKGISVRMVEEKKEQKTEKKAVRAEKKHAAEGDLTSEKEDIQEQARKSREPEGDGDLLEKN